MKKRILQIIANKIMNKMSSCKEKNIGFWYDLGVKLDEYTSERLDIELV